MNSTTSYKCFDYVVGGSHWGSYQLMKNRMFSSLKRGGWYCDIRKPHIVYFRLPDFRKYKNSHVLIVAGGPSCNTIDWQYHARNFTWSMNHCFLNEKLCRSHIDMIVLGAEVNLTDERLHMFLDKHRPYVGFEPHHKWLNKEIQTYINSDTFYQNMFAFATHFYGKIGVAVRMIILAAELGAKEVLFVGVDGPQPIIAGNHGFEPGKNLLPSQIDASNAQEVFQYQYDTFWKYVTKLYPNTTFTSLDKTNELHREIL